MAISTKKVLEFIEKSKKTFEKKLIIDHVLRKSTKKTNKYGKKNRSKGTVSSLSPGDIEKLNELLDALCDIGFLERQRKKYSKKGSFKFTGTVKVNTSGDAILPYSDEIPIIINRKKLSTAQNNDNVTCSIVDYKNGYFYGEVLDVIERGRDTFTGKINRISGDYYFISLLDTTADSEVCAPVMGNGPEQGDYAIIRLTEGAFLGKNLSRIESFFSLDNEDFDFPRIRIKHDLPADYSPDIIPDNPEALINKDELKNRKDYTKLFTITIDGEYSKDFDDAISIKCSGTSMKLYVHIADVSAYVHMGSKLDSEAYRRGTSYYLGNSVIPMLPESISNFACSLRAGEKKLTMTAEISFDMKGNMTKFEIFRGMIKVNKRLTYKQAENILNKKPVLRLSKTLHQMQSLARILNTKRSSQGRLDLNLTDEEIIYDGTHVREIRFASRLKSHTLIEEFMLSANEAVSKLLKDMKIPTLYRVHEEISEEKMEILKKFLATLGYNIGTKGNTGSNIQKILQSVSGKSYEQVVNLVVLKSMMQAYYGPEPKGHFGLGFEDYTHFTSPIRRYPDLVVHRCLKMYLDRASKKFSMEELVMMGEKTSTMERIAQKAERDMIKVKSCRIMKDRVGESFDVIINGFTKFGIFVSLIDMPIEGMIPLKNMTDDYYVLREEEFCIIGQRKNRRYSLGEKIEATLVTSDIDTLRIDFEPSRKRR